jgi:bifunctional DNA-binding transcriptional regulator/antitoxin component of YhaV-PrlF toxin-antitoxin module
MPARLISALMHLFRVMDLRTAGTKATMVVMDATVAARQERLIGALVPVSVPRPRPSPPPMPVVPRHAASEPTTLVVDMARLDRSGRLSARPLLRRLGWRPGDSVSVDVVDGAVVIGPATAGRHTVGSRGDVAIPAAVRQMCGIDPHQPVLGVAYPAWEMLVIHSIDRVAQVLARFYARLVGGLDGR